MKIFSRFPTWRRQTTVLLSVFALVAIPSVAYLAVITWTNNLVDSGFISASMYPIDLDGDGDIDLVGISQTYDDVAWYRNDGTQSFTKVTIDSNAPGVRDVEVGDIDNDGDIDIVIAQVDSTPDGVYWYDNDGDETFTKRTISTLDNPIYIDLADVNEDGELDVLASAYSIGDLVYYENLGGTPSTFTGSVIDDNMTTPRDVEAADIDGDGDIDILMTQASSSMQFYENDGSESFTETTFASILASSASYGLHIEDINGDTYLDMIVAGSAGIHYFESDGADDPTFTRSTVYSTGAQSDIDVADFDGDGDKDIVGSYETSSSLVRWFENDGSESFTTATVDSAVTYPWKVEAGDIDGDGYPDILVGSNQGIEWWENGTEVASTSTGGQGQARTRRAMYKRWRTGEYVFENTEAPSLASVGIFDPAEQAAVHAAAAGSGTTVEEEDEDDDDDQASVDLPSRIVQTGRDPIGTEQLERIARLHNRHTQKTQVVAVAEAEEEVTGEVVYESSQHQRVCERVERRFGDNLTMIDRINIRIKKRFGWICE